LTGKCFSFTGKYFPLTNFSNNKKIQENLKINFLKITFKKIKSLVLDGSGEVMCLEESLAESRKLYPS
jgi:hypothetical protein